MTTAADRRFFRGKDLRPSEGSATGQDPRGAGERWGGGQTKSSDSQGQMAKNDIAGTMKILTKEKNRLERRTLGAFGEKKPWRKGLCLRGSEGRRSTLEFCVLENQEGDGAAKGQGDLKLLRSWGKWELLNRSLAGTGTAPRGGNCFIPGRNAADD